MQLKIRSQFQILECTRGLDVEIGFEKHAVKEYTDYRPLGLSHFVQCALEIKLHAHKFVEII
jgi:hypothetical protein